MATRRTTKSSKRRSEQRAAELAVAQSQKEFVDNPRVDRRIINGLLSDREGLLKEMEELGHSSAAVMRRAAELGMSEALIRQVRGVAAELQGDRGRHNSGSTALGPRGCLQCDRVFLSTGPGNRLCMRCRGGDAGLSLL